jgi:hypothetical protein
VANAGQEDADSDDKGDACDACPAVANPGSAGCPVSVYDLKDGTIALTSPVPVAVPNLVVTAVASNGFWSQVDPTSAGFDGIDHACIFSFVGAGAKPAVGDQVNVTSANAQKFFDQVQLSGAVFTVVSSGVAVTPTVLDGNAAVTAAAAAGASAALEGCLVDVRNVVVTNASPEPGASDSSSPLNEFEVASSVRIDDALFLISPQPQQDETMLGIKGVLSWRNSLLKLLPRSADDVVLGPVSLDSVEGNTFVRVGTTNGQGIPSPLLVRLSRAAEADTVVTLVSSNTSALTVPASVTVLAGQATAAVPLTGLVAGSANVSATFNGETRSGSVTVLAADAAANVVAAEPTSVTLLDGQSTTLDVILDLPAPAGTSITLTTSTAGIVTIPASVSVTTDGVRATFTVAAANVGTTTITAQIGTGDEVDIDVVVQDAPSEVDLSGFQIVRASNGAAFTLPANTIVPINGYVVVARNSAKTAFETFWGTTLAANVKFVNTASDSVIVINATSGGYSLRRNANTVIDGPTIAATAPNSIQRNLPVGAADAAGSWTVVGADDATPGSGQAAGSPAASGCYISEISDAVGAGAFANEFVEIHCNGALAN